MYWKNKAVFEREKKREKFQYAAIESLLLFCVFTVNELTEVPPTTHNTMFKEENKPHIKLTGEYINQV